MNRASQTHPYFVRLFLDLDPAGNPIGRGAIGYEKGTEQATLHFSTPGPFDTVEEAWSDLLTEHRTRTGDQLELW